MRPTYFSASRTLCTLKDSETKHLHSKGLARQILHGRTAFVLLPLRQNLLSCDPSIWGIWGQWHCAVPVSKENFTKFDLAPGLSCPSTSCLFSENTAG